MSFRDVVRRFVQKSCKCDKCGRVDMYDISKKPACKSCGSHNVRPTKRPV